MNKWVYNPDQNCRSLRVWSRRCRGSEFHINVDAVMQNFLPSIFVLVDRTKKPPWSVTCRLERPGMYGNDVHHWSIQYQGCSSVDSEHSNLEDDPLLDSQLVYNVAKNWYNALLSASVSITSQAAASIIICSWCMLTDVTPYSVALQ